MKEISIERLAELLRKERKLDLLEIYGVDNWDGYSEAVIDELNIKTMSYIDMFSLSDDEITSNYKTIN